MSSTLLKTLLEKSSKNPESIAKTNPVEISDNISEEIPDELLGENHGGFSRWICNNLK